MKKVIAAERPRPTTSGLAWRSSEVEIVARLSGTGVPREREARHWTDQAQGAVELTELRGQHRPRMAGDAQRAVLPERLSRQEPARGANGVVAGGTIFSGHRQVEASAGDGVDDA